MTQIKTAFKINLAVKDLICLLVIFCMTLIYVLPIFKNITDISHNTDLTSYLSISYFQKLAITHYQQFPLWSPYFGGGYPIIGNIEDTSLTPLMPLILLFGEMAAFKLLCLFLYLAGGFGMYYLTRNIFKYSISGALFSVLVFVFNPYFYICIAGGDAKQLHYLLYPLLLALFLKSRENQKFLYLCSLIFMFMLFQADFVGLVFLLFLGLYIIPLILKQNPNQTKANFDLSYVYNFFKLIGISFFLGALKFIPLLHILRHNSRDITSYDLSASQATSFSELLNNLLGTHYTSTLHYSVGFIPIIFTIISIFIFRKKLKTLLLPLFIITWISLGPHAPLDLWRLFRQLPFFHSQQDLDQYYPIVIVLIISLISGKLFSLGQSDKNHSFLLKGFFSITLLIYAIFRLAFLPDHFNLFSHPKIKENLNSQAFSQAKVFCYSDQANATNINRDFIGPLEYFLIKNNIGTINWKACLTLAEHALPKYYIMPNYFFLAHNPGYTKIINPFYRGEAFTLDKTNTAELKYFSPLKLSIQAKLNTPDTVIVNQNYSPYWNSNTGKLESRDGLLAIRFKAPGNYSIQLNYIPFDFYLGLFISLLSLIFILFGLAPKIKPSYSKNQDQVKLNPLLQSNFLIQNNPRNIIVSIGIIAIIAQICTPVIPPIVLINRGCDEKARQDKEFLKSTKQIKPAQAFALKPWAIGQYAVYKMTGLEPNTYYYRIIITGREKIAGQDYFWLEHALYKKNSKTKVTFKTLRSPLPQDELIADPLFFFEQGVYPRNVKKMFMRLEDNPEIEISLDKLKEIISPLGFSISKNLLATNPQEILKQDIRIFSKKDCFRLANKKIDCQHLLFNINPQRENYCFNLWFSPEIPIMGLVQMDCYRLKQDPDYNSYPDKIVLVDYGTELK
ncbi:MAG: hypothetical protein KKD05_11070 [Candidatus Omnitrophica bacterium]|nr:hypothetical protein [Candidatus Omnitrophota bacterium]